MFQRTHILLAAVATLMLTAGCATSGSKSKSTSSAKESEKAGAKKADGGAGIPELEPLEFRSKAPEPEQVTEKYGVEAWEVGELTVLHKPTPANQVVSAKLYIDGGTANLSKKTAGIERLALQLSVKGGTESTPKDDFTSALDSMGSSVSAFADRDYSGYTMRCTTKHFQDSWRLFTEAILEPAMPQGELSVQQKKQIASLRQIRQNPNRLVSYLSRRMVAGDSHPYRHLQLGTKENVRNFDREDLLAYQRSLLNPSRMILVVVGDVSTDALLGKVAESVGRLKAERWTSPDLPDFGMKGIRVGGRDKEIPTNYIMGAFPAPKPTSKDFAAMKVAMKYLSDRLFEEIRTKRNLSYAVASGVTTRRTTKGYLYVSAKKPNETLGVMFDVVSKLKKERLSESQLKRTRNVFLTEHYMDLETNSSQATNLARAQLIRGDWRSHKTFLDDVKRVDPKDVRRVAKKYLGNYQFAVVGAPDSIDKSVIPE